MEGGDGYFGGESSSMLRGRQCEARYRHEALYHDGRVLVFGGGTRDTCISFKRLDALSVSLGEWGSVETAGDPMVGELEGFPAPRRCHALVRHKDRAYILGGFDGELMFSDVWWLDLSTAEPYQWTKSQTSLPKPLYFHSASITPEGCVYVFGGVLDSSGQNRSAEVLRMWLEPPSLQWSALRVLIKSHPKLLSSGKEELRRMGIPICLLDWVKFPDKPA